MMLADLEAASVQQDIAAELEEDERIECEADKSRKEHLREH